MQNSNTNTKDNLASEYLPSENEEYMNSQMLEYFKFKLEEWKDKLIQESNKEQAEIINKTGREADHVDEASLDQDRSIDI